MTRTNEMNEHIMDIAFFDKITKRAEDKGLKVETTFYENEDGEYILYMYVTGTPKEVRSALFGNHMYASQLRITGWETGNYYVRDNGWCEYVDESYIRRWIRNND